MTATDDTKELAHRAGDGVEVSLLWSKGRNRLTVEVFDTRTRDAFELEAHPDNALDAFYHPFAYAALRGVNYTSTAAPSADAEAFAA